MSRGHKPRSKIPTAKSKVFIAKDIKFCVFRPWLSILCFILFALCSLLTALSSHAKVTGNCSNCHTMHNSQGGQPVARGDAPWGGTGGSTDARPSLLVASCLGCHSSTTASEAIKEIGGSKIPIVFNTVEPTYGNKGLAAGNFYFVITDNTKGHNILSQDPYLSVAPGDTDKSTCGTNSCHANLYGIVSGTNSNLDGKQGCEKCHLEPKHHADDHGSTGGLVTTADQGWYRFLSGHSDGEGLGVEGYEDGDWQYTVTSTDHNEYLGKQLSGGSGFVLGDTTTAYCTGCHGRFHTNQGSQSPWLRHPSDAVLPGSGEYSSYTTYNPIVPVARPSLDVPRSVVSGTDGDMVMCLSCHRAHASPYFKMMRWDYKSSTLSEALSGCNVCHTSKN